MMRSLKACSYCCLRYLRKRKGFLGITDLMQPGFFHSHSMSSSKVRREVIISLSEDIHTNLALEDWLYEKADLETRNILLMWRNESAIVIGRHQNPWLECNVPEARKQGISLVRRKSGGGTVYHDKGNLNCSVLTNRKMYNRKENLYLVVKAIQSKWDIPLVVNSRDDIMMDGFYKMGSDTKATGSVPSQVMNLTDADRSVDFDSLTSAIAKQYLDKQDGQMRHLLPTEKEFPGIEEKIKELCDSNWTFNKTPTFSILREFVFSGGSKGAKTSGEDTKLKINVLIDKGRITTVEFRAAGLQCAQAQWALKEVQSNLTERNVNSQLITECVVKVEKKAAFLSHEEKKMLSWIMDCIKRLFNFC